MTLKQLAKYSHIIQAYKEGKKIQALVRNKWEDFPMGDTWLLDGSYEPEELRIKPEPKLRPWRPDEALGKAVRRNQWTEGSCAIITACTPDWALVWPPANSMLVQADFVKYEDLLNKFIQTNWLPCGAGELPGATTRD